MVHLIMVPPVEIRVMIHALQLQQQTAQLKVIYLMLDHIKSSQRKYSFGCVLFPMEQVLKFLLKSILIYQIPLHLLAAE